MNSGFKAVGLGLILALASSEALAAKKSKEPLPLPLTPAEEIPAPVEMTPEEYEKQAALAIKRSSRSPATSGNWESLMSAEMKNLRHELLTITSSEMMDKKISAISAKLEMQDAALKKEEATLNPGRKPGERGYVKAIYKGEDRDFRYFAAQIVPMKCLRGGVWKFTPIAEKSRFIDSMLVSSVYSLAQSMQIMTPSVDDIADPVKQEEEKKSGEANISKYAFDYITLPYEGATLFAEGIDLQEHLMNSCYRELEKSVWRIDRMDLSEPIVWDNKMFFGVGTFPNDLDRYKKLGEAERHFSLAMKYTGMHFISFFRSYSVKNYFATLSKFGEARFRDAFPELMQRGFNGIDGVNLRDRAKILREAGPTFTLLPDGAKFLKDYAWPSLKMAITHFDLVWKEVKDRPADQSRIINPAFLNAFGRATDESLKNWMAMTKGPVRLSSRITNRSILFDLSAFYTNPDKRVRDLRAFLPKADSFRTNVKPFFENTYSTYIRDVASNKNVEVVKTNGRIAQGSTLQYKKYRNWYYGGATAWDVNTWRVIFPELKDSNEIPQTLRTMSQAWGGSAMALPLFQFVR